MKLIALRSRVITIDTPALRAIEIDVLLALGELQALLAQTKRILNTEKV